MSKLDIDKIMAKSKENVYDHFDLTKMELWHQSIHTEDKITKITIQN